MSKIIRVHATTKIKIRVGMVKIQKSTIKQKLSNRKVLYEEVIATVTALSMRTLAWLHQ